MNAARKSSQTGGRKFQRRALRDNYNIHTLLSKPSESWERRAPHWEKEKGELEEMMFVKQKIWNYEEAEMKEGIIRLTKENIQLQWCCLSSLFKF